MFEKFNFRPFIHRALRELEFYKPTPIQDEIIPLIQKGENVIGKSQTGTGKTHAFLLPLLDGLKTGEELDALIIVPSRELGMQIFEEIKKIIKHHPGLVDARLYVGGTDRADETERLEKSQPQIAVATVGKLKDLAIDANLLKIYTARRVVVDEADMVFVPEELETIDRIFSVFADDVQTLVFSATINQELSVFLNRYLKSFAFVDLTERAITKEEIEHVFIPTKNKDKHALLVELLHLFHPYLALIFTNTREKAEAVASYLGHAGFKPGLLTGNLKPRERRQVLKRIREGAYQYVVATDLAARGMDITGVSHVINFELPRDIDFYIHRTGRTGRMDFTGTAISFYDYEDVDYLKKLERKGLRWVLKELKAGELVPAKTRSSQRKIRKEEVLAELKARIPLGKKVKPGYKKKRKQMIEKELKKMKRAYIDEKYRRLAKKK